MSTKVSRVGVLAADLLSALKRVDLPTLGRPTMPHLKPMDQLFSPRFSQRLRFSANALARLAWRSPVGAISRFAGAEAVTMVGLKVARATSVRKRASSPAARRGAAS